MRNEDIRSLIIGISRRNKVYSFVEKHVFHVSVICPYKVDTYNRVVNCVVNSVVMDDTTIDLLKSWDFDTLIDHFKGKVSLQCILLYSLVW